MKLTSSEAPTKIKAYTQIGNARDKHKAQEKNFLPQKSNIVTKIEQGTAINIVNIATRMHNNKVLDVILIIKDDVTYSLRG